MTVKTSFARALQKIWDFLIWWWHSLSHYNSITEPRSWFLLYLLEELTIDFPSHFILSLIDAYKDLATRNKLIFLSAITRILRHAFVSYRESTRFSVMCALVASWSLLLLLPRHLRMMTMTMMMTMMMIMMMRMRMLGSSVDDEMTAWVTCPLSFVAKRGSNFGYKSSHVLRGRVSIEDIFVRGSVFFFMRDVVRTYCIFSFLYFSNTLLLHCDSKPCTYVRYIYIYIYWGCFYFLSPISSCVVSFLSLCTCFLYIVCNLLFLFHTKMMWWVLFKMFQKYKLSKSFLPWKLFLQSFSRVYVRIRFYCIQQVRMSWVIYGFSHIFICLLWFCHGLPKGEIVRTYVNHVRNICHLELVNPLTKCILLIIW